MVLAVALLTGCDGAGPRPPLADQQLAVELSSRLADARVELATARRKLAEVRKPRVAVTRAMDVAAQPDGASRTVTAVVNGEAGPVAGVLVTFTVHGANAGASGS